MRSPAEFRTVHVQSAINVPLGDLSADALAPHARMDDAVYLICHSGGRSAPAAARLKSANEAAEAAGLPRYHVLQPEYNLVSRHKFEGELQDYCIDHNIGVVPYYGLASGFLTGKYRSRDDLGKSVRGGRLGDLLEGKGRKVLDALDAVSAESGATLAQIALAWLLAQPGVTAPIASATSLNQLDDIMGAIALELSADQLDRLTAAGA